MEITRAALAGGQVVARELAHTGRTLEVVLGSAWRVGPWMGKVARSHRALHRSHVPPISSTSAFER